MKSDHKHESNSDDCVIYDDEAASFSLKTWRISVNEDHEQLSKLIADPVLPNDAEALSVLAHEYHHWVSSFCSTYGLLVNALRHQAASEAATLANILLATGELRKPVIVSLRENKDKYKHNKEIEQIIQRYLNTKKIVDLLIGIRSSPYTDFCDLFPEVLVVFQRIKKSIPLYANSLNSFSDERAVWTTGQHLESMLPDEAFIDLLKSSGALLIQEQDPELDLHLQLNEFDRLNWPTLLEGHAKYFQRAYESVLLSLSSDYAEGNSHHAMHGLKDYEEWNSPYSRLRQVMVTIVGRDPNYCECCEIITLMALADLAINPSIDAEYFFPIEKYQVMQAFFPGHRFRLACMAAKEVRSIAQRLEGTDIKPDSLETAYKDFISECCSKLEWEPPWIQTQRWIDCYPKHSDNTKTKYAPLDHFLEGCRLRLSLPLFFGIPSHAETIKNNKRFNWFWILGKYLTIPNFASRDSFPVFSISDKKFCTIMTQQMDGMNFDILDQLMSCSGPLNWETIRGTLGNDQVVNDEVVKLVKQGLATRGIDLERVVY